MVAGVSSATGGTGGGALNLTLLKNQIANTLDENLPPEYTAIWVKGQNATQVRTRIEENVVSLVLDAYGSEVDAAGAGTTVDATIGLNTISGASDAMYASAADNATLNVALSGTTVPDGGSLWVDIEAGATLNLTQEGSGASDAIGVLRENNPGVPLEQVMVTGAATLVSTYPLLP